MRQIDFRFRRAGTRREEEEGIDIELEVGAHTEQREEIRKVEQDYEHCDRHNLRGPLRLRRRCVPDW